jgi:hypothetical protein
LFGQIAWDSNTSHCSSNLRCTDFVDIDNSNPCSDICERVSACLAYTARSASYDHHLAI